MKHPTPVRGELGYGPAVRRKPFRPHLTVGALSCALQPQRARHAPTARAPKAAGAHPGGFPHRRPSPAPIEPHLHPVLVLRSSCARRGITPAFGYGPRLGSVRLDFHQLATRPARRALRACPTSRARSSRDYRLSVPPAARRPLTCHPANHPGRGITNHQRATTRSLGSRAWSLSYVPGISDRAGPTNDSRITPPAVLPSARMGQRRHPELRWSFAAQ